MFELYSERARQVIFLARLESGARGAEMIDVDDLLAALIVEDQNKTPEFLEMLGRGGRFIGSTTHQPFLPPDVATSLPVCGTWAAGKPRLASPQRKRSRR